VNAYDDACTVEARARIVLLPFLKERAKDRQLVLFSKGALARHLQEVVGDLAYNTRSGIYLTVEMKSEESDKFGNLFLESWSNRNLEDRANHDIHGTNPGWMLKLSANLLFYYFIASDELYVIDMFKLKRWAFGLDINGHRRINRFPEKAQGKRTQRNDTWGWCVPIKILQKDVGLKKVFPRQIEMFDEVVA